MSVFSFPARTMVLDSALTASEGIPVTPWIPAVGISDIRAVARIRDIDHTDIVEVTPAYQTAATDTDSPDTPWVALGDVGSGTASWAKAADPDVYQRAHDGDGLSLSGKFFIRFGLLIKNASDNNSWRRAQATLLVSGRG